MKHCPYANEELLDLVNENDQVIAQRYRSEIYAEQLSNFRVINAFLINDQKQVWIPRRSAHKKLFPLCLDASVGGHVMSGENYEQAFVRELEEELNLDASQLPYKLILKLTPSQHRVSAYMCLYVIYTNATPQYNTNDFISSSWFSLPELQALIKKGEPTKGDLPILINALSETIKL